MRPRLLLIDNYDSFTYNLVQAFLVLGAEVLVYRNDAITVAEARALAPTHLCISPGPGTPYDAGVSMDMIRAFAGRSAGAGSVPRPPVDRRGVRRQSGARRTPDAWQDLARPARRARAFRRLAATVRGRTLPLADRRAGDTAAGADVSARTAEGEIMGVRHRDLAVEGVQFHPESILTPEGPRLLGNFLANGAGDGRGA